MRMTCDNDCTRAGWVEYMAYADGFDLHISVDPKADTDGTFDAFCHCEQEMIRVNGWTVTLEEIQEG